jgi:hypothetical protein
MLLAIGVWRVIVQDWIGILFLIISLILIFIKIGVLIDVQNIRLKKYIGIFTFKKGKWQSIKNITHIKIKCVQESQIMNVVSISRSQSNEVYSLVLVLPDTDIELISGNEKHIRKIAIEISKSLNTNVLDVTK